MAAIREFVTGQLQTAANVDDYLMKKSVQKYADAAARDAALGTAVGGGNALREGMVAYLDDEDAPSFYDGTSWGPISVPNAGIGSNVVTATNSSLFTTSSATFTPVTSMSVSITLSSATSKVLVFATSTGLSNSSSGDFAHVAIERDGNLLQASVARTVTGFYFDPWASFIVDTPGSVGPHTYTLQAKQSGGGTTRVEVGADGLIILTAIEVAA